MFLYRCASCGSDRVQLRDVNEGFSYGKAAMGTLVFGTAGAVAGLAGKKTTKYYCPQCGQTLDYPLGSTEAFHIDEALMNRANPSYEGVLRALKVTYPGIDWKDPSASDAGQGGAVIVKARPEINPNATTEALLERISGFVEDKDWENAAYYCEYLLDKEPSNAEVYKYKLLTEHKASDIYELGYILDVNSETLSGSSYNKFMKYGGEDAKNWEEEVNTIEREYRVRRLEARKREKYDKLVSAMDAHEYSSMDELLVTSAGFDELGDYEDSIKRSKECMELYERLKRELEDDKKRENIAAEEEKLKKADNEQTAASARDQLIWLTEEKEKYEKLYEERINELGKMRKKSRKNLVIFFAVAIVVLSAILFVRYGVPIIQNKSHYSNGIELMEKGNYEDAYNELHIASATIDVTQQMNELYKKSFDRGVQLFEDENYEEARDCFFIGSIGSSELENEVKPYRTYYTLLDNLERIKSGTGYFRIGDIVNPINELTKNGDFGNVSKLSEKYPIIAQINNLNGEWVGHQSLKIQNGICYWTFYLHTTAMVEELSIYITDGNIVIDGPEYLWTDQWLQYEAKQIVIDSVASDGSEFTYNGGEKYHRKK